MLPVELASLISGRSVASLFEIKSSRNWLSKLEFWMSDTYSR